LRRRGWHHDGAGECEVVILGDGVAALCIRRRRTEMRYIHGTAIKTFTSADGKHSVEIVERHDGSYQYHEHEYVEADAFSGPNWEPRRMSGIYSSAELAEHDALAEVSWLRGVTDR
jgi:hypothetical protein